VCVCVCVCVCGSVVFYDIQCPGMGSAAAGDGTSYISVCLFVGADTAYAGTR
jgi:hypothetical protein